MGSSLGHLESTTMKTIGRLTTWSSATWRRVTLPRETGRIHSRKETRKETYPKRNSDLILYSDVKTVFSLTDTGNNVVLL